MVQAPQSTAFPRGPRPFVCVLLFPPLWPRGLRDLSLPSWGVARQSFFPSVPTWTEGVDQRGPSSLLRGRLLRPVVRWLSSRGDLSVGDWVRWPVPLLLR